MRFSADFVVGIRVTWAWDTPPTPLRKPALHYRSVFAAPQRRPAVAFQAKQSCTISRDADGEAGAQVARSVRTDGMYLYGAR